MLDVVFTGSSAALLFKGDRNTEVYCYSYGNYTSSGRSLSSVYNGRGQN